MANTADPNQTSSLQSGLDIHDFLDYIYLKTCANNGTLEVATIRRRLYIFYEIKYCYIYTLQEMCCGVLLSREMWYRKSVLPGTGAG